MISLQQAKRDILPVRRQLQGQLQGASGLNQAQEFQLMQTLWLAAQPQKLARRIDCPMYLADARQESQARKMPLEQWVIGGQRQLQLHGVIVNTRGQDSRT